VSIAASHRPDPDELAAFVDGQLSGEEHQKLEAHLGACEACREVVAESLLLLEEVPETAVAAEADGAADVEPEGARILTHPRWRRVAWQLAPLAAAALLVLVLWPSLAVLGGPASSRELLAGFTDPHGLTARLDHGWPRLRGESYVKNLTPEKIAFRLGVRVFDLQVALKTDSENEVRATLEKLILLLKDGVDLSEFIWFRYQGALDQIAGGGELDEQALEAALDAEDELEKILDSAYFPLGRWAEAGRLAAMADDRNFFERRKFRGDARKLERAELSPEVTEQIRQIRGALEDHPLDEGAMETLRKAFVEIIRTTG